MSHRPPEGCHYFPDGNWKDCCHDHNVAYAARADRSEADRALRRCVAAKGHPVIAWIMWLGVCLGGWAFWG